jgi:hypothetical protein
VEHERKNVLAAGIGREAFERLAPVIRRASVQVDWVETPEAGIESAGKSPFDVIIMNADSRDLPLEEVVRSFRYSSSASSSAAILVLAEPEQVDVARALRSRGVNRVMLVTDPPEIICDQVANLLEVAPRVQVRLAANVEAAVGDAGQELFCQTVNLSSTGMLIRTRHRPALGSPVSFKITLSEDFGTINGRGELVRHTATGKGEVDGVAIRFVSIVEDGAERLQDYLDSLGGGPEPLTEVTGRASEAPTPTPPFATPIKLPPSKPKNPEDGVILEFE